MYFGIQAISNQIQVCVSFKECFSCAGSDPFFLYDFAQNYNFAPELILFAFSP
jgi:hypothetical protein